MDLLRDIRKSPLLPERIKELAAYWDQEQQRRHTFWATHGEGTKAQFIEDEVIHCHSPSYGRHWKASSNIIRHLLPYVSERQLGEIAYEKTKS